jgi:hypothetical protein
MLFKFLPPKEGIKMGEVHLARTGPDIENQ